MPARPHLTPSRIKILELLAEYRSLSSSQIRRELQPEKHYSHTLGELEALRSLKMVGNYLIDPRSGKLGWFLLKKGAVAVKVQDYGSHYRYKHTYQSMLYFDLKLALVRQVKTVAGWLLIKPLHYNSQLKLPAVTPQGKLLLEALKEAEYRVIKNITEKDPYQPGLIERSRRFNVGMYEERVFLQANDYVIYKGQGNSLIAIVLILAPFNASKKFWQGRFAQYANLAVDSTNSPGSAVSVVAIFKDSAQAEPYKTHIKSVGFKVTTIERVDKILSTSGTW